MAIRWTILPTLDDVELSTHHVCTAAAVEALRKIAEELAALRVVLEKAIKADVGRRS